MEIKSFNKNIVFNDKKVVVEVLLETPFSKEIRILLKQGQVMQEHTAPRPIIIHIIQGEINFRIGGETHKLSTGNLISLQPNIAHDLTALQDSIVRLTLSKS